MRGPTERRMPRYPARNVNGTTLEAIRRQDGNASRKRRSHWTSERQEWAPKRSRRAASDRNASAHNGAGITFN